MVYTNNDVSDYKFNIFDVQAELLGSVILVNKFMDTTILKKEYFHPDYAAIFEAMKESYKKHGAIINQDIYTSNVDIELYTLCIGCGYSNYEKFESNQNYLIEQYRDKQIAKLSNQFENKQISLEEFEKKINELKELSVTSATRITARSIAESCLSKKSELRFVEFKKLQSIMRAKEHDLIILAGGTGVGKSGCALNLLNDLSKSYPCLYFNFEMGSDEFNCICQTKYSPQSNRKMAHCKISNS